MICAWMRLFVGHRARSFADVCWCLLARIIRDFRVIARGHSWAYIFVPSGSAADFFGKLFRLRNFGDREVMEKIWAKIARRIMGSMGVWGNNRGNRRNMGREDSDTWLIALVVLVVCSVRSAFLWFG